MKKHVIEVQLDRTKHPRQVVAETIRKSKEECALVLLQEGKEVVFMLDADDMLHKSRYIKLLEMFLAKPRKEYRITVWYTDNDKLYREEIP